MFKMMKVLVFCLVVFVVVGPAAMAQDVSATAEDQDVSAAAKITAPTTSGFSMNPGAAFGAGLVIIGAALGISRIGGQAVESMARQPEVAGNIQTAMIISAALIEGATFFALIVCMLFN